MDETPYKLVTKPIQLALDGCLATHFQGARIPNAFYESSFRLYEEQGLLAKCRLRIGGGCVGWSMLGRVGL
jgi:hypothetical protein